MVTVPEAPFSIAFLFRLPVPFGNSSEPLSWLQASFWKEEKEAKSSAVAVECTGYFFRCLQVEGAGDQGAKPRGFKDQLSLM